MADVTQELQAKITYDDQGAQQGFSDLGDSLQSVGSIVSGIIISDILVNLYNQIVNLGEAAINSSASLQNIGVAANYAFGSSSASEKMLTTLNDISTTTPFTNEQLDQLAIRMANMNVPTNQIQGNLKDLADIASATGTSVSEMSSVFQSSGDVLALAYERGSIASLQLRAIANQGIPIYDALVTVINKEGVATAESAKAKEANASKIIAAQAQQVALTQQLANAERSLQLTQQQAPDSQLTLDKYNLSLQKAQENVDKLSQTLAINQRSVGTYAYNQLVQQLDNAQQNLKDIKNAAPDTALAMDKYNFSLDKSQQAITDLNKKLQDNKDLLAQLSGAPQQITKADLLNNTKNITISAQQLQEALATIAQGKDLGAAQAQAQTYTGVLKNLQQQFQETADEILGVSQAGVVTKGGLFDSLQTQLSNFLAFLAEHKGEIVQFAQNAINSFVNQVAPAIQTGFNWIIAHREDIKQFILTLSNDIVNLAVAITTRIVPALVSMGDWFERNKPLLQETANILSNIIGFITKIGTAKEDPATHGTSQGGLWQQLNLPHFATGVENFTGGLALVGERGAEIVNLPQGSSVTPHDKIMPEVHIHNPIVRNDSDITAIIKQVKFALGRQNELARLGAI